MEENDFIQKASMIYAQTWLQRHQPDSPIKLAQEAYAFADHLLKLIGKKTTPEDDAKKIYLGRLPFNVRTLNCMKNMKLNTLYDLLKTGRFTLQRTKNFGKKSILHIDDVLKDMGYELTERGIEWKQHT